MPIRLYEDGTIIDYARSPGSRPPGGVVNGSKRKTYLLTGKHKRLIRCSAIRQALSAKYRIMFATLTFPHDIDQKEANKCFSNFVDNLTTNFKLHSYVAVKENTKRGRPHFHILLDIPFTDYKILNKAWCSSFRRLMPYSPNAFTTGRNPIISNIEQITRYITKYITKAETACEHIQPDSRLYFISQNVHSRPERIEPFIKSYLLYKHPHELHEGDYFTWFKLYEFHELPEVTRKRLIRITESQRKRKQKKPRGSPRKSDANQLQFDIKYPYKVDKSYNS